MRRLIQWIATCVLCAACAAPAQAAVIQFLAGVNDSFGASPPVEDAIPSAALIALSPTAFQDFDVSAGINGGVADRNVAHTFVGLPENIAGAALQMRVRAGSAAGVDSDGVFFAFAEADTATLLDAVVFRPRASAADAVGERQRGALHPRPR